MCCLCALPYFAKVLEKWVIKHEVCVLNFTFIWPRTVTNFFVIKPTRCTNSTNLFWYEGPGSWPCSKAVYKPVWHIPLLSAQCTNSWWWAEELSDTCRYSCQNKFAESVHLVGFITKRCVFWFSIRHSSTTFLILRRILQDIINIHRSLRKVLFLFVQVY